MLPTIRIRPDAGRPPDAAIVLLHGLGADAEEFRGVAEMLGPFGTANVEYALPQAPEQPVTVNGGLTMPAWFDILTMDGERQDADGIHRAASELEEIIAEAHGRGIAHKRIFVGGFSQGGAVALHCAARGSRPLGGAVGLSSYLPLMTEYPSAATAGGRATPVFMSHGEHDDIIPLKYMRASRRALEQAEVDVTSQEYPLGHSFDTLVLADLSRWLSRRLSPGQPADAR